MGTRTSKDPFWIGALCRVYAGALWLYPPAHRKRWGSPMLQAFRDRCREAARDGRGPLRVVFTELLPDLASTVGSEHFDSIHQETNPMKRLLYVLIATFIAVVLLHPRVTPAVDAVHGWWQHREEVAFDRAYSGHLEALAQATEQQRRDSHDDVTAAILYWNATSDAGRERPIYWDFGHGYGVVSVPDSRDATANNALRDHADAAFARALKADDPWALWVAVFGCPARPSVCARDTSLARLKQVDADNGAVWLMEIHAAERANDPTRERAALGRFARSTSFNAHEGDAVRALLRAFDKVPMPSRLVVDNEWVHTTPITSAPLVAYALADSTGVSSLSGDTYDYIKPFVEFCRSKDPQIHAERQSDCRAAGKLMADHNELWVGYRVWMRNANPGEQDQLRAAFREYSWVEWGATARENPRNTEAQILAWKAAWLAGGNWIDVNRRLLQEQGIPLNAPASFQLRPEQDLATNP